MTYVVFLGPSLPLSEAARILPEATYLPPARQGDIATVLADAPTAIGLVDGEFLQSRSVWHKEILLALERGIHVFGASSMGALRAAELEPYGMVGVGEIFARYASGELIDDDEVAVAYHRTEAGYHLVSEPMVNIRATLAAAARSGVVSPATCQAALEVAKRLYFPDRRREAVIAGLRERGVSASERKALSEFWRTSSVDLKAEDARLLLRTLRRFSLDPPPPRPATAAVFRTAALDSLYDRERRITTGGGAISLGDLAEFVKLHHPDVAALNAAALNRGLVLVLAKLLHVDPEPAEVEREITRWRIRHGQCDDRDFEEWLRRNHLSRDEFRQLAYEAAQCRALWRWLMYCRHVERSDRLVLDYLRWSDQYEVWVRNELAALYAACDPVAELDTGLDGITPESLVAEHTDATAVCFDTDLGQWAEEMGFNSPEHLVLALNRARRARARLLAEMTHVTREREPKEA